jgi:hypothetical protein
MKFVNDDIIEGVRREIVEVVLPRQGLHYRETARIDALFARVTAVIEWLKEYRTALISSAVTGTIDVREGI